EIREVQAHKEKTKEVRSQLDDFKRRLQQLDEGETTQQIKQLTDKLPAKPKNKPKPKPKKSDDKKRPLAAGDNVILKGASTVGTILSVDEKYALVAFGNLKTRVETERLERTLKKATTIAGKPASISASTTDGIRSRQLQFKPDIDVRGMRADEALQAITYFIDDAIQFNASRVRILHGTGTGVLREVIRQYLNSVPGVVSYRDEHVQFGGAGITIVDLE
ncbi:MAG: Smr/MutS family protein, partial [Muribaculaceae bacterium]|nr:Smr/MutS family protein [Muribaculaceae bacterium]